MQKNQHILRHLHTSGYAFLLKTIVARSGSTITATTAAHSVPSIYMIVTIRNCWPFPFPAFAIELMTRANTSIGAIALSALTNMVPIRLVYNRFHNSKKRRTDSCFCSPPLHFYNILFYDQTSSAISLTSLSFAHCSSSVSLFPISHDANPH